MSNIQTVYRDDRSDSVIRRYMTPDNSDYDINRIITEYDNVLSSLKNETKDKDKIDKEFYYEDLPVDGLGTHDNVMLIKGDPNLSELDRVMGNYDGDTVKVYLDKLDYGDDKTKNYIQNAVKGAGYDNSVEFRFIGFDAAEIPHYKFVPKNASSTKFITRDYGSIKGNKEYVTENRDYDNTQNLKFYYNDSTKKFHQIKSTGSGMIYLDKDESTRQLYSGGIKAQNDLKNLLEKNKGNIYYLVDKNVINKRGDMDAYNSPGQDMYGRFLAVPYVKTPDGRFINVSKYIISQNHESINLLPKFSEDPNQLGSMAVSNLFNIPSYDYKQLLKDELAKNLRKSLDDRDKVHRSLIRMNSGYNELREWTVTIGDCTFLIPPTSIASSTTTTSERMPLIRGKGSMVKDSPKVLRTIELDLYFYGEDGINGQEYITTLPNGKTVKYYMNGLRSLVSQFKFTPFLPIDNEYINDVLGIEAVTVREISISTLENYPKAINAKLILEEFEYRQYMPEVPILHDEEGEQLNAFASCFNFETLRYYCQKPIIYGNEMAAKSHDPNFKTNKTCLMPMSFKNDKLSLSIIDEDYLKRLKRIKEDERKKNVHGQTSGKAKHNIESLADKYNNTTDDNNNIADKYKGVFDKIENDINGKKIKDSDAQKMIDREFERIVKYLNPSLTVFDTIFPKNMNPFGNDGILEIRKGDIRPVIERDDNGTAKVTGLQFNASFKNKYYNEYKEFIEKDIADIAQKLGKNREEITIVDNGVNKIPFVLPIEDGKPKLSNNGKSLNLFENNPNNIISLAKQIKDSNGKGIYDEQEDYDDTKDKMEQNNLEVLKYNKINFENLIIEKMQTVLSNRYSKIGTSSTAGYAPQFLGGQDIQVQITIRTSDNDELEQLLALPRLSSFFIRAYRDVLDCAPIKANNDFLNLFDIHECTIENINTYTQEGFPGVTMVELTLMSVARSEREKESLKKIDIGDSKNTNLKYHGPYKEHRDAAVSEVLHSKLLNIEVYPDLELPTIEEMELSGLRYIRYKDQSNRKFVDPDFYMYYGHEMTNEFYNRIIDGMVKNGLEELDMVDDKNGGATMSIDTNGEIKTEFNDVSKMEIAQHNRNKSTRANARHKEDDPLIYNEKKPEADNKNIKTDSAWKIGKDIELKFLDKKHENDLRANVEREKWVDSQFKKYDEIVEGIDKVLSNGITPGSSINFGPVEEAAKDFISQNQGLFDKLQLSNMDEHIFTGIVKAAKEAKDYKKLYNDKMPDSTEEAKMKEVHGKKTNSAGEELFIASHVKNGLASNGIVETYYKVGEDIHELEHSLDQKVRKNYDNIIEFGVFRIKKYTPDELRRILMSDDLIFLDTDSTKSSKQKRYVIDPYYRNKEKEYIKYCAFNTSFATHAFLRNVLYMIKCMIKDKLIPNLEDDITDEDLIKEMEKIREEVLENKYEELVKESEDKIRQMELNAYERWRRENERDSSSPDSEDDDDKDSEDKDKDDKDSDKKDSKDDDDEDSDSDSNSSSSSKKTGKTEYGSGSKGYLSDVSDARKVDTRTEEEKRKIGREQLEAEGKKIEEEEKKDKNKKDDTAEKEKVEDDIVDEVQNFFDELDKIKTYDSVEEMVKDYDRKWANGKIFAGALLAITDKNKDLYDLMKSRNYPALNSKTDYFKLPPNLSNLENHEVATLKFMKSLADDGIIPSVSGDKNKMQNIIEGNNPELKTIGDIMQAINDPRIFIKDSFHDMMMYDKRGRLLRAFPSFFMMIIDKGQQISDYKMSDIFYSISSIAEISVSKSRKIAADTAKITVSNMFNTFDVDNESEDLNDDPNREISDMAKDFLEMVFKTKDYVQKLNTKRLQNTVTRAEITAGARIHIRMGYGSSASDLPIAFNGKVAEVTTGEVVDIIAQGDGIELMNTMSEDYGSEDIKRKGKFPAMMVNGLVNANSPKTTIDSLLNMSNNFFKNVISGISNGLFYGSHPYGIENFGAYDRNQKSGMWGERTQNIFEATNMQLTGDKEYDDVVGATEEDPPMFSVNIFGKTFWDVLHEAKSLSPDFIAAVATHDFRSTVFHGLNRHYYAYSTTSINGEPVEKRKPFQQYHIITSVSDIITNNIAASSVNIKTNAVGIYDRSGSQMQTLPQFIDYDIYSEYQKSMVVDTQFMMKHSAPSFLGKLATTIEDNKADDKGRYISGYKIARKAAISALKDSVKDMYQGSLTVLGNPAIKPYDRISIYDMYESMTGIFEVKSVVTSISAEHGFITTVEPDCISVFEDQFEFMTQAGVASLTAPVMSDMIKNAGLWAFKRMTASILLNKYLGQKAVGSISGLGSKVIGKIATSSNVLRSLTPKALSSMVSNATKKGAVSAAAKGAGGKISSLFAAAGPAGIVAMIISAVTIEVLATSVVNKLTRYVESLNVLTVCPIRKNGFVLISGLNGHSGSVLGSMSYDDDGFIKGQIYDFFGKSNSGVVNGIKGLFFGDDIMNHIANRKAMHQAGQSASYQIMSALAESEVNNFNIFDRTQFSELNSSIGKNRLAEKSNIVADSKANLSLNSYQKNMYKRRINPTSKSQLAMVYERDAIKDADEISSSREITEKNMNIKEDPDMIKMIRDGFLRIVHDEESSSSRIVDIPSGSNSIKIRAIETYNKNGGKVYDVPFLKEDALNVLKSIVLRTTKYVPNEEPEKNHKPPNYVLLKSALRVGDKSLAAGGYSFIIENITTDDSVTNVSIGDAISEIQEELTAIQIGNPDINANFIQFNQENLSGRAREATITILPRLS